MFLISLDIFTSVPPTPEHAKNNTANDFLRRTGQLAYSKPRRCSLMSTFAHHVHLLHDNSPATQDALREPMSLPTNPAARPPGVRRCAASCASGARAVDAGAEMGGWEREKHDVGSWQSGNYAITVCNWCDLNPTRAMPYRLRSILKKSWVRKENPAVHQVA